ncbi:tyrosine-type recombinase/integrase [Bacillus sp. EB106-08-02-XG196]|uniref:tyrosine-type recombinase/integrase n=1 Tax=Bacillus sp. EB106-08-02-XG196 TaxID=2737049 RepID=UPI0015C48BBF|nr:tyrosine-type recombinase/integrase [Bacillus sp. EB106-08-02-XG196]NWQ40349.1 tyrosine-type recombinase/integrase [Bacillus sp. EB106-08-02-XG196]
MELYCKEIENFIISTNYKDNTKKRYKEKLVHFGEFLSEVTEQNYADLHLEKIYELIDINGKTVRYLPLNAVLIDQFLFSRTTLGYSWISVCHAALKSFFKYLLRNYNFNNVMLETEFKLKLYTPLRVPPRILNRHEIIRFLRSIVKHSKNIKRDLLLFILLLSTGARKNEILNITVDKIDFANDLVFLQETKNNRSHYLILRDGIGKFIQKYCVENQLSQSDKLFYDLTYNSVNDLLNSYLTFANLPNVNVHSTRHSFATIMFESGSLITTIQQLLNHIALSSTRSYIEPNYIRNLNIHVPENEEVYKAINLRCKPYLQL